MDPYYAANAFFLGAGSNRGALEVSQSGTAGQLAQRVQRSAYPSKYDQREGDALGILAQLGAGQGDSTDWSSASAGAGGYAADEWHLSEYQDLASSGMSAVVVIALAVVGILVIDSLVNG